MPLLLSQAVLTALQGRDVTLAEDTEAAPGAAGAAAAGATGALLAAGSTSRKSFSLATTSPGAAGAAAEAGVPGHLHLPLIGGSVI